MTELTYDLSGPAGNAFAIMAYAKRVYRMQGHTPAEVTAFFMTAVRGDYDHLLNKVTEETGITFIGRASPDA